MGSRFWPMSKSTYPKQFHDLMGVGETLLQSTFSRLAKVVPSENILILTNDAYIEIVQEQLPKVSREQIVLEPAMRNTAPCILLAALKIRKKNPEAVMLVAPCDHWIENTKAFIDDVLIAFDAAASDKALITLGIQPSFPNTGYGYIKYFEGGNDKTSLQKVERFTEKPSLDNARKYLEDGNYVWNAGIFIWSAASIIESFSTYLNDMYKLFSDGNDSLNKEGEIEYIKEVYPKAQDISIDYGILEKSNNVYVIPASFDWDDLGTWGALYSKMEKDEDRNAVVNARLFPYKAKNNMIRTNTDKIVVVDGLENYIIVDDHDVLLIVPKEKEQEIKSIRAEVLKKFGDNLG